MRPARRPFEPRRPASRRIPGRRTPSSENAPLGCSRRLQSWFPPECNWTFPTPLLWTHVAPVVVHPVAHWHGITIASNVQEVLRIHTFTNVEPKSAYTVQRQWNNIFLLKLQNNQQIFMFHECICSFSLVLQWKSKIFFLFFFQCLYLYLSLAHYTIFSLSLSWIASGWEILRVLSRNKIRSVLLLITLTYVLNLIKAVESNSLLLDS